MRIAVDLLGGDDAPAVVVDGALRACGADPDLSLLLVGPTEVAGELVGVLGDRVSVEPVRRAVRMTDPPLRGVRPDTTVRAAVAAVADRRADALVTAGASGAAVAAAVHGFGRLPGISRPALATTIPARTGPVVLLDVGATTEASPQVLVQYATLGAEYATAVHDIAGPRVGLLTVGTEHGKGDRVRRAADAALRGTPRYAGPVEGYTVTLGGADVVVTDGFTGNVLLKGIEGAYALAAGHGHASGPELSVPRAAALLGVAGAVVVCHGAATGPDVASGIALAATLWRMDLTSRLAKLEPDPSKEAPS